MKIGWQGFRAAIILGSAAVAWWVAMFWPDPHHQKIPSTIRGFATDTPYGYPLKFAVDYPDIPGMTNEWYPWNFLVDALFWGAIVSLVAAILWWITKPARPRPGP